MKNNRKMLIIMIGLTLVTLIGSSYALLRSTSMGTNPYVMNVGNLQVDFLDEQTKNLTLTNAYPMTDEEGMEQSKELEFTIKNNGNLKANYNVYIEETSTNPEFKTVIRYAVNKNDIGYGDALGIDKDNMLYIDKNAVIDIAEEVNYKLKIWLGEEAGNEYMNKEFTARIVVEALQNRVIADNIEAILNDSNSITEDGITYISGSKEDIDFNYVWYSGKMWRVTAIYPDGSMKMITDNNITAIAFGSDSTFYTNENNKSYAYQWLNEDFLDTLYNYENIIDTSKLWNATSLNERNYETKLEETTMVNANVGLLNSYEYFMSYKNAKRLDEYYALNGYLNNGLWNYLINPFNNTNIVGISTWNGNYSNKRSCDKSIQLGIRPSIYLKPNIMFKSGTGVKENPYRIAIDYKDATDNELLNTRLSGEYLKLSNNSNDLYRIIEVSNNLTKIVSLNAVKENGEEVKKAFTTNCSVYGEENNNDIWYGYLNNIWYTNLVNKYGNIFESGPYYIGTVGEDGNYKTSICSTVSGNTTKDCQKINSISFNVGLSRYGEMFSIFRNENNIDTIYITKYDACYGWSQSSYGYSSYKYLAPTSLNLVHPSLYLKSNIKITSGTGLPNDPFEISL